MKTLLQSILISSLALSLTASTLATETTHTEDTASLAISTQTLASPASDFQFSNGTITKYVGNGGDVVIPEYINGELVTTIGEDAFYNPYDEGTENITSVTMPDSITSIELCAFSNTKFTEITLSQNLQSMGSRVFADSKLVSITLPDSLTTLPSHTFAWCYDLEEVHFGKNLTTIERDAFFSCSSLKNITLPNSLQSIGSLAFCLATALEEVVIPEGVTMIEQSAFSYCSALRTVHFPKSLKNIQQFVFDDSDNISTVYYAGSASDKSAMDIVASYTDEFNMTSRSNQSLLNANWVYNTPVPVQATEEQAPVVTETTTKVATPSNVRVLVNGAEVGFGAYNIDGFNYFRLTDLSFSISGTVNQFRVGWDASQNAINLLMGEGHVILGSELQANSGKNEVAHLFQSPIFCDGSLITPTVYEINGSSYFQLASLTEILGISVGWDNDSKTITIDTGR